MSFGLHNLKSVPHKKRKRVGRGNASGHGTYSTRGVKGQSARSGGNIRPAFALKIMQRLPKLKGFKSRQPKKAVLNLGDLSLKFKAGALIHPAALREKGLIDNIKAGVKILGGGNLLLENLKIQGCQVSKTARAQIEKMGGKIESKIEPDYQNQRNKKPKLKK